MPVIDRSSDTYRFFTFTPTLLLLLACTAASPHELVAPTAPMPSTVEAHCRVTYVDSDDSYSVNSGDRLNLPSEDPDAGPFDDSIVLARENDTLGRGHRLKRDTQGLWQVALGADPVLMIGNPVRMDSAAGSRSLLNPLGDACDLIDARLEELVPLFETAVARRTKLMQQWAAGGNASYYYHLSNYLEGLTSMYEATRMLRYLELAVNHIGQTISSGKDLDDDGYYDYLSRGSNINQGNIALHE